MLTTSFPRHDGDLAGAFVLGFARAIADAGHEVTVLAPEPRAGSPPSWPGVSLRWVAYLRPRRLQRTFYGAGVPDNLARDPRAWLGVAPFVLALRRAAARELAGCDALVSHWAAPCALVAGAVARGRPHLAVLHSADVHALARLPGGRRLARRALAGASSIRFVAPHHREAVLAMLPVEQRSAACARSHVEPMGVDPPALPDRAAARRALGVEGRAWLMLARLVPIKGVDVALRALAGRRDEELLVAGDGPELEPLRRLARAVGARARFVGVATGVDKARLLAAADALLVPSRHARGGRTEGAPVAALEAMAAGVPVVASRVGGLSSLVEHGATGMLVAPDDPGALRAAIDALAGDERLRRRLGEAGVRASQPRLWSAQAPRILAALGAEERPAPRATFGP